MTEANDSICEVSTRPCEARRPRRQRAFAAVVTEATPEAKVIGCYTKFTSIAQ